MKGCQTVSYDSASLIYLNLTCTTMKLNPQKTSKGFLQMLFVNTCLNGRTVAIATQSAVSKVSSWFFFLSVSFCSSVADYSVHSTRNGPGLAYWRARQPERQSACHILGAPKLDASSSPQMQSHTQLCMNKYSSTPEHWIYLVSYYLVFFFFFVIPRFTSRSVLFWCYCA